MDTVKYNFLLLAGGQGILLSLALIASGIRKKRPGMFLGFLMFVFAIELLNVWAMSLQYHTQPDAFPFWVLGSYLVIPSSLWVFLMYNTSPVFQFREKHLFLFLPALIEIITEFIAFYLGRDADGLIRFLKSDGWFVFTELLPLVWMIGVLIQYAYLLRKHSQQDSRNSSYLTKQYGFLVMFSAFAVLWVADGIFHLPVYSIIQLILCLFIFVMGYAVYFQPDFFETPFVTKSKSEELFVAFDDEASFIRVKKLLEEEKLYLKPRLSVNQVAERLNLPGRYISHLINKMSGNNFPAFINQYRVAEVLERLNDPKERHKTIIGIALDCGFSSKSSFNQIFKTVTGKTPSEYQSESRK